MQHRSLSLRTWFLVGGLVAGWCAGSVVGAPFSRGTGNDTCIDGAVDWYTDSVKETPCRTYERLRQICNHNFVTPSMSPFTPPDQCNDKHDGCCCNAVSFALSMLCMNCQYGRGSTPENGIDAGVGSYLGYGNGCNPPQSDFLAQGIQQQVCASGPPLPEFLFETSFYPTGQWFYNITAQKGISDAQNSNVPTQCGSSSNAGASNAGASNSSLPSSPNTNATSNATTSSSSLAGAASSLVSAPSTSATSNSTSPADTIAAAKKSTVSAGAIAAIVVAGLALLVAAVIAFFLCRLRRQRGRIFAARGSEPVHGDEYRSTPFTYSRPSTPQVQPQVTSVSRYSITTVGPSINPSRTDFSHSPPSSPPAVPVPTHSRQSPTSNANRVDLTAGEDHQPRRSRWNSLRRKSNAAGAGAAAYPFWHASSDHTPSSEPSEADDGERIRDSVLHSFDPRGMVRQTPPVSPRPRFVVNNP